MPRSTERARHATALAAMLMALCLNGCPPHTLISPIVSKNTGEPETQADTTRPTTLGGPGDSSLAGVPFVTRKTPPLPAYFEDLNQQQLVNYLNSLVYDIDPKNTEIELATCTHATTSTPCSLAEGAQVAIQPEIGAHKWAHNSVPKFGFVVARVINYDATDRMERTFEIPANTQAWWVVDQDPATHEPRSRFFRRTYSSSPPYVQRLGPVHDFFECGHAHNNGHSQAITKFVSCSQSLTMAEPDARGEAFRGAASGASARIFHLASWAPFSRDAARPDIIQLRASWVTCDMGCCSTSR